MPRVINDVYLKICEYENLNNAFNQAKKNKRYRNDVLTFSSNLEENLLVLQNELISKSYKVGKYKDFYIHEPKKRLIMALPFRDRVVQWAIHLVINDFYERTFITHNYACITNRGTHIAVKNMHRWIKHVHRKEYKKYYYLKMDIAKYFYRIDHDDLVRILKKKIKDPDTIWLMETIIRSDHKFGLELNHDDDVRVNHKGIPIGNLTSQLLANIYLNELDQFVKREMKIKYYMRYMDDFVILNDDKEVLIIVRIIIEKFLAKELKLQLNNKTCIRPISLGLEFLGYRVWWSHIKLKKKTALRMKRNLKRNLNQFNKKMIDYTIANSTFQSYKGILKHCNSYRLLEKIQKFKIRRRLMFVFTDRKTKTILKQVDITEESFKDDYDNNLVNIFSEYDAVKHIATYKLQ